jgi:hypothetical protein
MTTTFFTTAAADQVRDYMPATPLMLTATSYWRIGQRRAKWQASGQIPTVKLPPHVTEVAADSGGFVAAQRYGGHYPFSFEAYVAWLRSVPNLTWAALPDLPVERELARTHENVRERQELTLRWAAELWGDGYDDGSEGFELRLAQPWSWVATVQGRTIDDYVWMAEELAVFVGSQEMEADWLATATPDELEDATQLTGISPETAGRWGAHVTKHRRIGIGSLCRRTNMTEVVEIVKAVSEILPDQRFHLWGVKLGALDALKRAGLLDRIASLDSAAWNNRFGRDIERQRSSGMDQRSYAWNVAWPAYKAKLDLTLNALPATRQLPLAA